ncbi:hypothetical protein GEO35_01240 [Bifidobacterium breve]|nr:hypothetical protein GEO35_01240 [Bifidobacterium breve]TQC86784.1 hypothetical protein FKD14_09570 [Bifidobacterium breve]
MVSRTKYLFEGSYHSAKRRMYLSEPSYRRFNPQHTFRGADLNRSGGLLPFQGAGHPPDEA